MALNDDYYEVLNALKNKPAELGAFQRLMKRLDDLEKSQKTTRSQGLPPVNSLDEQG